MEIDKHYCLQKSACQAKQAKRMSAVHQLEAQFVHLHRANVKYCSDPPNRGMTCLAFREIKAARPRTGMHATTTLHKDCYCCKDDQQYKSKQRRPLLPLSEPIDIERQKLQRGGIWGGSLSPPRGCRGPFQYSEAVPLSHTIKGAMHHR